MVKPWEVALGADRLSGQLSIDLKSPTPQDTLNADLLVRNGQLALIGLQFDVWNFSHIETNLTVRDGIVKKSSASVQLAGLKGSADINFLNPQEMVRLKLQGKAVDLKPFLPEAMQNGIDKKMQSDEITVDATIAEAVNGFDVQGILKITNAQSADSPLVHFGFDLEKSLYDTIASEPSTQGFLRYWQTVAPVTLEKFSPPSLKTLASLESRWVVQELGIQGFVMRGGWFKAEGVSLSKFLSPFLFTEDEYALEGTSNFSGHFDQQGLFVRYDVSHATLENAYLAIDFKEVSAQNPAEEALPAMHYFDFARGKHFGELPIKNASYFDKNSGLLFTDVHALIVFEGAKIHALDVETFCNGIYLAGTIDLDRSMPVAGHYELEMVIDTLHGKFSQVQQFFSHFDKPFLFLNVPLEAEVALRGKGGKLIFTFNAEGYGFQATCEGSLTEGNFQSSALDLNIRELALNFAYDHRGNTLEFSDIEGALFIGKPTQEEEYAIHGERFAFSDYERNQAEFDIWISDRSRDLIRLAGKTLPSTTLEKDQEIIFAFDNELTHFGDIHPKEVRLTLIDWTKLESAQLDFNFRLSTFLYDLQKLSRLSLFLSGDLLTELNSLKNAGGDFNVSLGYEADNGIFAFKAHAHDIIFGDCQFKSLALAGSKMGKAWTIEQLQLDQITISADIVKESNLWKANFLGIRYGQSLLMGLDGEYREGESDLKAHVNLLELNLNEIDEFRIKIFR